MEGFDGPLCLDLDESERNAPVGPCVTITVGGIAYRRSDSRPLTDEVVVLKRSFGLEAGDELKYNAAPGHPSRVKWERKGLSRLRVIAQTLTAVRDWPVSVVGHIELMPGGARGDARTRVYVGCMRQSILSLAEPLRHRPAAHGHQVRIASPGTEIGLEPFREYQAMHATGLEELGFEADLASSPAATSHLLQIADMVVGSLSEYLTCKAKLLERGSAFRDPQWPTENFQLIARRAFLPGGALGVTISTGSQELAASLQEAVTVDSLMTNDGNDITPVRVFARPQQPPAAGEATQHDWEQRTAG